MIAEGPKEVQLLDCEMIMMKVLMAPHLSSGFNSFLSYFEKNKIGL
jgi:hypothetical protein